ncbi:MAG: heme-copper oxidase subunit III [Planctomycetes bacterium]|nr:heme-copper oxidase subunit III [Planctomycetota bacterium]
MAVPRSRLDPARLGVWLLLVTEAMFFAGLIAAYLVLREGSSNFGAPAGHLSLRLAAVATLMLACCSLCISRADVALTRKRGPRIVASWVLRTVLFGGLFLCLLAVEWRECFKAGVTPRTNLYWSSFFVLTGVHGLHVFGGVLWAAWAWASARRGLNPVRTQLAALYWHFVDVVWLVLFTLLYLV